MRWKFWQHPTQLPIPKDCDQPNGFAFGLYLGDRWNHDWKHHISAISQVTGLSRKEAMLFRILHEQLALNARLATPVHYQPLMQSPFETVDKGA